MDKSQSTLQSVKLLLDTAFLLVAEFIQSRNLHVMYEFLLLSDFMKASVASLEFLLNLCQANVYSQRR